MTSGTAPRTPASPGRWSRLSLPGLPGPEKRAILCALLLCAVSTSAQAADWDLARLARSVADSGPGTYRFAEERHLQDLTEPLRLEGTLSYTAQGHLIRRVTSPRPEETLIVGNLLTIQTNPADPPMRVLLSDQPVLNALILALRATLTGDLQMLNENFETELAGSEQGWTLRLIPDSDDLRQSVDGVMIEGRANEIRSIEIFEANGDRAVITIHSRT